MDQAAPDGSTQSPHPASPEHLHAEEQLTQRLEALLHRSEAAHLRVPAWLRPTSPENRLPVAVAILVVIALQLALPDRYALQPRPLAPTLELLLLAVLVGINPVRLTRASRLSRVMSIILVAAISTQNIIATVSLASAILRGQTGQDAVGLLGSGAAVFATNIIAFGVWYWELDRGGPFARAAGMQPCPDFLFPQMSDPHLAPPDWQPLFLDYLYVSFTNVVAFSPTDTMPLSRWAKALMTVQSTVALSTLVLVVARAINVLQ